MLFFLVGRKKKNDSHFLAVARLSLSPPTQAEQQGPHPSTEGILGKLEDALHGRLHFFFLLNECGAVLAGGLSVLQGVASARLHNEPRSAC